MMEKYNGMNPVIGVILMVTITVILAAIIAAFVFGISGGYRKEEPCRSNLSIEFMDGQVWNTTIAEFSGEFQVKNDVLILGNLSFPIYNIRRWTLEHCWTDMI